MVTGCFRRGRHSKRPLDPGARMRRRQGCCVHLGPRGQLPSGVILDECTALTSGQLYRGLERPDR